MARKRRRGGSSASKRQLKITKKITEINNTEIVYEDCSDNSGGTAVSTATTDQTSSSENSNLEMKIVTEGVHKKFGKFRCVIEESVGTEDPLKVESTHNELAYVNTEESFADTEEKPFLGNEIFAVEEVRTSNSEDVSSEENVQIITVEDNSISSEQSGAIYITLKENEKDIGSFDNTNENVLKEINEEQNDDITNLMEISSFAENYEDNAIIECNIINNEEDIGGREDDVNKNEDNGNNKELIDDEKDNVKYENINIQEIMEENQTEEGIVYMNEEELQIEEIVDNEEELKISNKLSALNVNVENENMDVINNDEDSQKSQEIVYDVENLGFELTIECGPEEVVPTEQEIEYENEEKMKEVEAEDIETTRHEICIKVENSRNKESENISANEDHPEIVTNDTEKQQLLKERELLKALTISKDGEPKDVNSTDEKEIDKDMNYDEQKEILETVENEKEDHVTLTEQEEIKSDDQENICTDNVEHEQVQIKGKNQEKSAKKQRQVRKIDKKIKVRTKADQKEFKKKSASDIKKEEIQEEAEKAKVRRSTRIKSIGVKQIQKTDKPTAKNKGTTKNKKGESDSSEGTNSGNNDSEKLSTENSNVSTISVNLVTEQKPVKVKSRWRRSSELEMGANKNSDNDKNCLENILTAEEEIKIRLKQFVHLKDNSYLTDRVCCKEAKKMVCDCFLTQEEIDRGEYGCGEDCLNRLLMIECGPLCSLGDRCTNKRFQKSKQSACEVFRTEKKGLGIRATKVIPDGEFILEYVGEVINPDEFEDRATEYSKGKNSHFYFMALRSDAVIDATQKGNISRFINHSCEPNAETQKWTVNGELRIGFFSKKTIQVGEEITFDYHFQRYGKEAQKCYCEALSCRGWLGEEPDDDEDEDEAEEIEEEDEEIEDEESEDKKKDEGDKPGKTKKDVVVKEKPKKSIKDECAKEDLVLTDELRKSATETPEKIKLKEEKNRTINKIKTPKSKPNKILQKTRKELFDDSDLNEEIQTLMSTGLKNQAHTLKLSRLMVRASEIMQKSNLLRVLRRGEFPCRRLFLDYHGLRLIHGWMTDAQRYCKTDMKQESLRLEILQTLATLPIPNKTMLQDSKVLLTVEKWSVSLKKDDELDSDSNSPKLEEDEFAVDDTQNKTNSKSIETMEVINDIKAKEVKEEKEEDTDEIEIRKSVGMDHENIVKRQDKSVSGLVEKINVSHFANLFEDDILDIIEKEVEKATKPEVPEYEVEIVALALKLLEEWSTLKEVFRIPKKERIERMKEHEREANRGYKPTMENDLERKRLNRYRQLQRPSRFDVELRMRKPFPILERTPNPFKFNKHERRKLFALQVEQEEEKRRKMHSFMKQEVAVLGPDLRLGSQHDVKFQYMWNPQTGQWQKVQILNQNPTTVTQTPPQKQPMVPHPPPVLQNLNQPAPRLPYPFNSYSANISSGSHSQLSSFPAIQPNVPQVSHYPPVITSTGMPSMLQHANRLPELQSSNLLLPPGMNAPPPGNPPLPIIAPLLNTTTEDKTEDVSQVRFAGPIPPPVKLPPKWKCAKDKYGRPYYYHIKIRISQWEPPGLPAAEDSEDESSETTLSSDSSSVSSESCSEDSDSDEDEVDDTKLMIEIKKNLKNMETKLVSEQDDSNSREDIQQKDTALSDSFQSEKKPSLEERLKMEFNFLKGDKDKEPPVKRRRSGLVTEVHIISPRTEEDKILAKENLKKYKDNKEKLKRQKEHSLKKAKQSKDTSGEQPKKRIRVTVKGPKHKKLKEKDKLNEVDNETAKKIKEAFRSSMASVMVNILNPFRKPDCKEGHISNNEDFKHLARKLTHFVMLKELKHCKSIEDLTCTDSVKNKAKEFVRKYMAKFGEKYIRPKDEMDF